MSTTGKTWTTIIIIVVIIVIGWIWYKNSAGTPSSATQTSTSTAQSTSSDQSATAGAPAMSAPNDTSDAALQADLNSVDGQMTNLNADASNADQGMNSSAQPGQ